MTRAFHAPAPPRRLSRRGRAASLPALAWALALAGVTAPGVGCGGEAGPRWEFPDVCVAEQPPDEACYVGKRDPGSEEVALATELADRYMAEHPPESLDWDWAPGVLLFALTELHRITGDPALLAYARAFLDHHLAEGYPMSWSDHCPPALAALALYRETGEPAYRAVVEDAIALVETEAIRTEDGGINHLGTVELFEPTLWLDSLFMFGELLTRWTEETGDPRHLEELGRQIRIFASHLQTDGGLFLHAYQWPAAPDPDVLWARGNGWVTASGYDYLRARALRGERDEDVAAILARQVAAVQQTQDATGLWWTVMDHPGEIYLETSASALFGLGLARGFRYGALGPDVLPTVARALAGVRSRIARDDQGRPYVTGISGPTSAGEWVDYATVDLEDDLHFGVGAVILFLVEASGLAEAQSPDSGGRGASP